MLDVMPKKKTILSDNRPISNRCITFARAYTHHASLFVQFLPSQILYPSLCVQNSTAVLYVNTHTHTLMRKIFDGLLVSHPLFKEA